MNAIPHYKPGDRVRVTQTGGGPWIPDKFVGSTGRIIAIELPEFYVQLDDFGPGEWYLHPNQVEKVTP